MERTFNIIAIIVFMALSVTFAAAQTTLSSINGERVDVQGQRGKVVILAVGAKWLPLSAKQAEYTNVLAKKYAGRDVAIFFIATDSLTRPRNSATNDELARFGTENKLAVPILRDPDAAASIKVFGVDQVPTFLILDKQGQLVGKPIGGIDPKFDITVPISKVVDGLL
jgi:thiol-disulfide isomerase/thioredoxin